MGREWKGTDRWKSKNQGEGTPLHGEGVGARALVYLAAVLDLIPRVE